MSSKRQRTLADFVTLADGTDLPGVPATTEAKRPVKKSKKNDKKQHMRRLASMFILKAPQYEHIHVVIGSFTSCDAHLFIMPVSSKPGVIQYNRAAFAFAHRFPGLVPDETTIVARDAVLLKEDESRDVAIAWCGVRDNDYEPSHTDRIEMRLASLWGCLETLVDMIAERPWATRIALAYPTLCAPIACRRFDDEEALKTVDKRVMTAYDQFAEYLARKRPDATVYVVRYPDEANEHH